MYIPTSSPAIAPTKIFWLENNVSSLFYFLQHINDFKFALFWYIIIIEVMNLKNMNLMSKLFYIKLKISQVGEKLFFAS